MMRIAVPVSNGEISTHFGHAQSFEMLDVEPDLCEIIEQKTVPAPSHQPGLLPEWLRHQGVDAVIAGGVGSRALSLLADRDIQVVVGVYRKSAAEAVSAYLQGSIHEGTNICVHSGCAHAL